MNNDCSLKSTENGERTDNEERKYLSDLEARTLCSSESGRGRFALEAALPVYLFAPGALHVLEGAVVDEWVGYGLSSSREWVGIMVCKVAMGVFGGDWERDGVANLGSKKRWRGWGGESR
ncbi:hypothetical protein ACFX15_030926 [Malus domestica]